MTNSVSYLIEIECLGENYYGWKIYRIGFFGSRAFVDGATGFREHSKALKAATIALAKRANL